MTRRSAILNTAGLMLLPGRAALRAQQPGPKNPLADFSASIRNLARQASQAVVEVTVNGFTTSTEGGSRNPDQISRKRSNGSGVVVDKSGLIMTNSHVVQGATSIRVTLATSPPADAPNGPRTFEARLVGEDRAFDLALLSIQAGALPALTFGDSESVAEGDLVLAIGSPLNFRNSLSMGVVSGTARVVSDESPLLYLQTDASINPGNSGGALLDTGGKLIGLNTYIMSQSGGSEGIGFAIPSNIVRRVYQQLRRDGKLSRGSIGVFVQDISAPMAAALSLPLRNGVLVADVDPAGGGAYAGIQRRDVILTVDARPVLTAREFNDALMWRENGESVGLSVQRADERISLEANVQRITDPVDPLMLTGSPDKSLVARLGMFCLEVNRAVADAIPVMKKQYGLIVAARLPDSQAAMADLRPGDIIHSLNRIPVATLDAFRQRIDEFARGEAVALQIEREGRLRYVAFEIDQPAAG